MNKPFLLRPAVKDYLWGGTRLRDEYSKGSGSDRKLLAETWECSTHPEGPSIVRSGVHAGRVLPAVIREHPEYLGSEWKDRGDLPILIKLIDAREDLSVQVHPTDEYASEHEGGQLGKTEMWYVLDAAKDAELVYGLKQDTDTETLQRAAYGGTISDYLQKVPVKKDDLFFIEAGTIHALGAGTLIAEIQENSNLTYRLYDYGRRDGDGKKRPLQIEKALRVADLKHHSAPRHLHRTLNYRPGAVDELLARCRYFEVYRMLVNTGRRQQVSLQTDSRSFRVLLCIAGCGSIVFDGEVLTICKGDCVFVPAQSVELNFHGQLQLLDVRV